MARAPKWWIRLFRQTSTLEKPQQISDLGFPDAPGRGLLHDGFRLAAFNDAIGGRERCMSAVDYLRKTLKHTSHLAKEVGDDELADLLERRCEWLASQVLVVVSDLEAELRERGYHERG
ncbi:hypothetical protein [Nonomuraea sp. NPDC049646]|uniref:hypothetical protein n=1 Tax=unclassified Nonomuraea TaxID=2593643 RepID=UPI00379B33F8